MNTPQTEGIRTNTVLSGICLICLIFMSAVPAFAQVSIAPTSLFFDKQNQFSSLTISNGGQRAQEVSISTYFGYPVTQNGGIKIIKDSALARQKSIAEWIKIFPENFTLQPQQRQTVRFVVHPPNSLDPGGYWTRVNIRSNPVSPPLETVEKGEVGARINLIVNQVIAANYRTPGATTGVEVTSVDFNQVDSTNTGHISVSLKKKGNAPFMGSLQVEVKNGEGETVYKNKTTSSVYTTITNSFSMDLSDIKTGKYTVSGTIRSERPDINQDKLLQIQPVNFRKEISIE